MLSILYFHYMSLWHHETSHKHNTQSCINIFKWNCWTTDLTCLELKSVPHAVRCEGVSRVLFTSGNILVWQSKIKECHLPHFRTHAMPPHRDRQLRVFHLQLKLINGLHSFNWEISLKMNYQLRLLQQKSWKIIRMKHEDSSLNVGQKVNDDSNKYYWFSPLTRSKMQSY